ncbi:MAG: hypothetical protein AAGB46_16190, partial [Verrucomicrobiota bacterium]
MESFVFLVQLRVRALFRRLFWSLGSKLALACFWMVNQPLEADDGPVVDFMVVYRAEARAIVGGEAGMFRRARQTEAFANQVFFSSGIDARLRLTHVAEVSYVEQSVASLDRNLLSNDAEISSLRNKYGADLVFLVRNGTSASASALSNPEGDDEQAYFIAGAEISSGPSAGAGFWGLCFGAGRDYDANNPGGLFEYSHAYRFVGSDGETYRTITTLNNGRTIHRFSNPDLNVLGSPIGVDSG